MFVGITNTPRDYAWGSRTAIASLLGRAPSGSPEAELWLGTHPGSPSRLASGGTLDQLTTLPFLLKVLAAASPLSLQAHPNLSQARAGFDRENALGIPLDAPFRNYKDALHKPELMYALSPTFEALCGFRPVAATRELLTALGTSAGASSASGPGSSAAAGTSSAAAGTSSGASVLDPLVSSLLDRLADDASLPSVFEWLISRGAGVSELVARVVELAASRPSSSSSALLKMKEFATVTALADAYPGDPGIVISLLLNRVTLSRGEVLYLPAGNIHAYLSGLGIELMAASDNVLRGGLTPKHIDVPELLSVLDFTPLPVPLLAPLRPSPGVAVYRPGVPDFELVVIAPPLGSAENEGGSAAYAPESDSIALCTEGVLQIRGTLGEFELRRGDAVYIAADEAPLTFRGAGTAFLADAGSGG
jgi:mannose-6-phosphate isomerase